MTTDQNGFRLIPFFSGFPGLVAAESRRHGGISPPPYHSLNLGLYTEDEPANIRENRSRFFGSLGISPQQTAGTFQVHGHDILRVSTPGQYQHYDGLITAEPGLFLTITVADCLPVLIYDSRQQTVGAAHAGWRGTVGRIAVRCFQQMQQSFGSRPEDCYAWLGTCIGRHSFEVDADVADHFDPAFKVWDAEKQKYFIDLKQANKQQLLDCKLPEKQIGVSPYSTVIDNRDYFSYRKEGGRCGRMLAVIGMRSQPPG